MHMQIGIKTLQILRLKDHSYTLKFLIFCCTFLQLHVKFGREGRREGGLFTVVAALI